MITVLAKLRASIKGGRLRQLPDFHPLREFHGATCTQMIAMIDKAEAKVAQNRGVVADELSITDVDQKGPLVLAAASCELS